MSHEQFVGEHVQVPGNGLQVPSPGPEADQAAPPPAAAPPLPPPAPAAPPSADDPDGARRQTLLATLGGQLRAARAAMAAAADQPARHPGVALPTAAEAAATTPAAPAADKPTSACPPRRACSPGRGRRRSPSAFNARKHGIFVSVLSGNERRRFNRLVARFAEELRPTGALETVLVEKIALTCLRLQRCARAEAVYYEGVWGPQPGRKVQTMADAFNEERFEKTVTLIGRYDATLTNQFIKLRRELAAVQEARLAMQAEAAAAAAAEHPVGNVSHPLIAVAEDRRGGSGTALTPPIDARPPAGHRATLAPPPEAPPAATSSPATTAAPAAAPKRPVSSVQSADLQKQAPPEPHRPTHSWFAIKEPAQQPPQKPFQGIPGAPEKPRTDHARPFDDPDEPSVHRRSRSKFRWL